MNTINAVAICLLGACCIWQWFAIIASHKRIDALQKRMHENEIAIGNEAQQNVRLTQKFVRLLNSYGIEDA